MNHSYLVRLASLLNVADMPGGSSREQKRVAVASYLTGDRLSTVNSSAIINFCPETFALTTDFFHSISTS